MYTNVTLNGSSTIEEGKQSSYKCVAAGGKPDPNITYWYLKFPNNTEVLLNTTGPNSTLNFTPDRSHNGSSLYCKVIQLAHKPPSISNNVSLNVQCKGVFYSFTITRNNSSISLTFPTLSHF